MSKKSYTKHLAEIIRMLKGKLIEPVNVDGKDYYVLNMFEARAEIMEENKRLQGEVERLQDAEEYATKRLERIKEWRAECSKLRAENNKLGAIIDDVSESRRSKCIGYTGGGSPALWYDLNSVEVALCGLGPHSTALTAQEAKVDEK